ncbi:MAG: hypothetical protein ACNI28_09195 [Arcobacter sp.]|uniref:hypothetical protein n=1 Tax=Arcobacter sp. TaxID=1872629 RepID=UPI003AFF87FA
MRIGRGIKNRKSFYTKRLKKYVEYLQSFNNEEINIIISEINNDDNLFSDKLIRGFNAEWSHFNKEITEHLNYMLSRFSKKEPLYQKLLRIGTIILEDDSISNKKFLKYLYKNEIALVLGRKLNDFHEAYYQDALERESIRDLMQLYKFKYLNNKLRVNKVAVSVYEILKNKKDTKKELLEEWSFNAIPNLEKLGYLKSLKLNVSEREYIRLLKMYAKLDYITKVKYYIFKELYEKGILVEDLELRKIAFSENITNKGRGSKYFYLLFNMAKQENDIDTIKWMYYQYSFQYFAKSRDSSIGRKDVAEFLNLPLYA